VKPAESKLGERPYEREERDAVHVAIIPALATERLKPGQRVAFTTNTGPQAARSKNAMGVVDPFLYDDVQEGEYFWMVLNPGSITSLRHDWEHPLIGPREAARTPRLSTSSEKWIQEYAAEIGLNYHDLIAAAQRYLSDGEYLDRGGLLDGVYLRDEFWEHFGVVTGTVVPFDDRHNFFTCSC